VDAPILFLNSVPLDHLTTMDSTTLPCIAYGDTEDATQLIEVSWSPNLSPPGTKPDWIEYTYWPNWYDDYVPKWDTAPGEGDPIPDDTALTLNWGPFTLGPQGSEEGEKEFVFHIRAFAPTAGELVDDTVTCGSG
jgi:hypothetical protein